MAPKKRTKKKRPAKSKRPIRKKTTSRKTAKRPRKSAKKKPASKKTPKRKASRRRQLRSKSRRSSASTFPARRRESPSGELAGDLQGLSHREAADSESVDELVEEGNAFEANAVLGVEDAGNTEGREVHTREVPEDDVPGEYLDEQ
jgi:hypothetical protein